MKSDTHAKRRYAGVMLPLASLPSRHGVGDMGESAYRFVDMLAENNIGLWQILPLNPLGYGNSPYQPYASQAGDPIYISLDALHGQGLLAQKPASFEENAARIDYKAARRYKEDILRQAYEHFVPKEAYVRFAAVPWVYDYAVFMAFKRANGMRSWHEWPDEQKNWPLMRELDMTAWENAIGFEMFLQYTFYEQWMALKAYANGHGIRIIGDIPIYVGIDSLDVWTGRENFLLDEDGEATVVAGVPPDYFSELGQRWGNPIYNWDYMQANGFSFWIERLRQSSRLFDMIRIDHFRGFDTYWEIPADSPTAVQGIWREAPGYALFDAVREALPDIVIIAEDLGMLREEVYALRDHFGFRGMKIIEFTFDPKASRHAQEALEHMVVYTGTHDNETVAGWFAGHPLRWRLAARWRMLRDGYKGGAMAHRFVRLALDDAADIAIVPAQDILGLGDEARINTPGTVGSPNWEWKLADFDMLAQGLAWYGKTAAGSGRV